MITTTDDTLDRDTKPDWFQPQNRHVWRPYTQMQTTSEAVPVASTSGVRLHLSDGRDLIDGVSSWWTACHGYCHPHIIQAIQNQVATMPHIMLAGLTHEPVERLASRLAAVAPGSLDHVFFCESGSVAVEIAMKMAIQYWINCGVKSRKRFVSFRGGYHGDSLATMSVCDPDEGMHTMFAGVVPEQIIADLPQNAESVERFEALLDAHEGEIAAVMVEPLVQGAGGMKFHSVETLKVMRAACDKRDLILIFDEIMTGFGRLGTLFAANKAGVTPDIMTVSKALTGGALPLAAAIASTRIFDSFYSDDATRALMHGPTYMGNPAACAAANASLDLFEQEPRLQQVAQIESIFASHLPKASDIPGVVDVRWRGAIGVIELEGLPELDDLRSRYVEAGVWVRPFHNVVYLMPSYVISEADLVHLIDTMISVTRTWASEHFD
jgi:adenosylmethionine-8-amino-7-oxononanoate aminotransferase